MISKNDNKVIKKLQNRWTDFIYSRRKKEFEYSDDHPHWLSVLERENMLDTLLNILNKYKKDCTSTTYEYEID